MVARMYDGFIIADQPVRYTSCYLDLTTFSAPRSGFIFCCRKCFGLRITIAE